MYCKLLLDVKSLPLFLHHSPLWVLVAHCLTAIHHKFSLVKRVRVVAYPPDLVFLYVRSEEIMQSTRFHFSGLAAMFSLALLLLLAQNLPNKTRPDAIKPVGWSAQQGMGGHRDSDRKTWKDTEWSQFAYVQYVTNLPYLCNSIMLFERLHSLGCKPDRVMMHPSGFSLDDNSTEARLLRKARDEYKVKLTAVDVQQRTDTQDRKLPKQRELQRH